MRRTTAGLVSLALVAGGAAAIAAPSASAAPPQQRPEAAPVEHDLPNPLEEKRRELRETALTAVLNGEATPEKRGSSTVVEVDELESDAKKDKSKKAAAGQDEKGKDTQTQYVELEREATDKIFTIIAEFGDRRDPLYPDQDTNPATEGPATFEGPLHNQIPEPDRSVDNSTNWQADYNREHYQQIYFGEGESSVASYYETQSSGRYSVEGYVSDWVKVPFNEARYGRSTDNPNDANGDDPNVCASVVCQNTWALVEDGVKVWMRDQRRAGKSKAEIVAMLAEYDVWDRYDFDGDGEFNESDGYLDHFQIVHAGGDEADGDPQQGEDAIWSHRWYVNATDQGSTGPEGNPLGGAEIGSTGIWVGDYTMQPENGGLGVFVHEYGHDLGLPDLYDTAGGQNDVEYWSLMAQSRLNDEGEPLGTRPGDLDPWSKLQLGWLDYEIVPAGNTRTIDLGPGQYNTAKAQAAVVPLPDKEKTTELGAPAAGEFQWWSGSGDNLANTMARPIDLTGATTSAQLTFQGRWDIEVDYDYLYVQASTDGGTTWQDLDGTVNGLPFPDDDPDGEGSPALTDVQEDWADVVVPMDQFVGQAVDFRFLYRTDGGVAPIGFFADEIVFSADGTPVVSSGAEAAPEGWTLDGFSAVGATQTEAYDNFYIASKRQYLSYDQYLESGPYNFGFPDRPNFVEHFPYQEGLLVWYWDTSFADNNTSQHPGGGLNLPIDAHPRPFYNLEGQAWRTRIQVYDAPFSLEKADSFNLHINGKESYVRGQAAEPVFNDKGKYWYPEMPNHGVKLPAAGVRIKVLEDTGDGMRIRIS